MMYFRILGRIGMFCVDDCAGLCAFWLMGWLTAQLYGVQCEVDIRLLADPSQGQISRTTSFQEEQHSTTSFASNYGLALLSDPRSTY
jgi:hypothetical protein